MGWFRRRSDAIASAPPLSSAQAAQLGEEITRLAQAGLPLSAGLRALADEAPSARLRLALWALSDHLERGEPLPQALGNASRRLPAYIRTLLLSPAACQRLPTLLSAQLEEERRARQLLSEARAAAVYPSLIAGLFFLVFCGLIGLLARPITAIMHEFELELPSSTELLEALAEHGATILLAIVTGAVATWLAMRLVLPRRRRHAVLKLFPLYGPLWRYLNLARWTRTLAQLVDAEVALPEAVRLAGDATDDADLAGASRDAARQLEHGAPLAIALGGPTAFPPWLGPTLAWGANHRQLPAALLAAGDALAARTRRQISFISVALPAIAFVVVIWGGAFLVTAAFLPLIKLIETLT